MGWFRDWLRTVATDHGCNRSRIGSERRLGGGLPCCGASAIAWYKPILVAFRTFQERQCYFAVLASISTGRDVAVRAM